MKYLLAITLFACDLAAQTINGISSQRVDDSVIYAQNYTTFALACTAASTTKTLIVETAFTAIPTASYACNLQFRKGGTLAPASAATLTLTGSLDAPPMTIFDLSAGSGAKVLLSSAKLTEAYPQWWGAITGDSTDDSTALNQMIASFAKRMHLIAGVYNISSTITCGSQTTSCPSLEIYGDGTWDTTTVAATSFVWGGSANGTMLRFSSAQNINLRGFHVDGNASAGIGILFDGSNAGGGSNHENEVYNLSFAAMGGTPGIGLYISGNQYSLTNQDVCCTSWYELKFYPGTAIDVKIDGTQSIGHTFFAPIFTQYTSRGIDIEEGDATLYSAQFVSNSTGTVADVYVAETANNFMSRDSYHEIPAGTAATRSVFNFPGTGGGPARDIETARILWSLASGTIINHQQVGQLTLRNVNVINGGGAGAGTITVGANAMTVTLDSNTFQSNITYAINAAVPVVEINPAGISWRDSTGATNGGLAGRKLYFPGSTSGVVTVQPAAAAGTWALTLPTTAGTNGYSLTTNGSGVTTWTNVSGGGGGAPTTATYITQTADGTLSAEQALGALSTGCLGSATTTGVVSARTITGTTNQITVANGDCSGNPTISIPNSPVFTTPDIGAATGTSLSVTGSLTSGSSSSVAGTLELTQGTAPSAGTTSVKLYAPTSVTSYVRVLPGAAGTGFYLGTNSSGVVTDTQVASSGTGNVCLTTSCSMTTPAIGAATGASLVLTGALTSNALTSGRVTFAGTSGILQDDADMTFATDTLTVAKLIGSTSITDSGLTSGRVTFAGTSGLLADDADFTFATDTATITKIAATTSLTVAGAAVTNNVVQNSQSAAYTTVLGDAGKQILHPTADNNARTFTIDSNANVAYPIGTTLTFINQINTVTIAITSDTLTLAGAGTTGSRTLAANGIATAIKIASTAWMINGTGLN